MQAMTALLEVEETRLLFTAEHRQIIRLPTMVTAPILLRTMSGLMAPIPLLQWNLRGFQIQQLLLQRELHFQMEAIHTSRRILRAVTVRL